MAVLTGVPVAGEVSTDFRDSTGGGTRAGPCAAAGG